MYGYRPIPGGQLPIGGLGGAMHGAHSPDRRSCLRRGADDRAPDRALTHGKFLKAKNAAVWQAGWGPAKWMDGAAGGGRGRANPRRAAKSGIGDRARSRADARRPRPIRCDGGGGKGSTSTSHHGASRRSRDACARQPHGAGVHSQKLAFRRPEAFASTRGSGMGGVAVPSGVFAATTFAVVIQPLRRRQWWARTASSPLPRGRRTITGRIRDARKRAPDDQTDPRGATGIDETVIQRAPRDGTEAWPNWITHPGAAELTGGVDELQQIVIVVVTGRQPAAPRAPRSLERWSSWRDLHGALPQRG